MSRVLIVEDSATQAAELRLTLVREGFEAERAANARAALSRLGEGHFDLVLSDIVMPGLSGFDLCRAIKADPALHALPVILLTSLNDLTDILQGLECGADNYVTKPYETRSLVDRIHQTLAKRAHRESGSGPDDMIFRGQHLRVTADKQQILGFLLSAFEDFARAKTDEQESRLAAEQDRLAAEAARVREALLRKEKEHEEELARTLAQKIEERTAELVAANQQLQREIFIRKLAEEELARKATALSRSNAELEQFARAASHDLQEPLRTVMSYAQLIARRYQGRLDPDADDFLRFITDGTSRMQALIKGLLEVSRLGSAPAAENAIDCNDLLGQALANLQAALAESGATITHDPLPTVAADPRQLLQLLQNLIGNALKYRGETPPRVHVSASRHEDGSWLFSVRDNGIGFDPRYADRIFALFQRLHTQEEYPGTGIGLALCKKIVERHGGQMRADSVPGEGSTFYFTLPALPDGPP
ncbi:ATP-binding protein [Chondromyces apiculatus]|uniref:histidine kinase n=1 Tax=Chondromyces apiculatus DSM 436 TaxID=1192034 RepID=A0A017SXX0_9BACT|nr:ATP-binding protein [Chondromyces apiculatus]EYF01818.1 Phytochrome, two-component sensor histidine kinase [Chondromyces apiculatus DSM 436]